MTNRWRKTCSQDDLLKYTEAHSACFQGIVQATAPPLPCPATGVDKIQILRSRLMQGNRAGRAHIVEIAVVLTLEALNTGGLELGYRTNSHRKLFTDECKKTRFSTMESPSQNHYGRHTVTTVTSWMLSGHQNTLCAGTLHTLCFSLCAGTLQNLSHRYSAFSQTVPVQYFCPADCVSVSVSN